MQQRKRRPGSEGGAKEGALSHLCTLPMLSYSGFQSSPRHELDKYGSLLGLPIIATMLQLHPKYAPPWPSMFPRLIFERRPSDNSGCLSHFLHQEFSSGWIQGFLGDPLCSSSPFICYLSLWWWRLFLLVCGDFFARATISGCVNTCDFKFLCICLEVAKSRLLQTNAHRADSVKPHQFL